jgi:peptide-methionine (S)-S-oxide reductase
MVRLLSGFALSILSLLGLNACAQKGDTQGYPHSKTFQQMNQTPASTTTNGLQVATFGAGCFWCTEAQFQQLKGVEKVESGYMGGKMKNPTYHDVCTGNTGHAEVSRVTYDPKVVSYDELLAAFWTAHDPTQLNRQGNDVGTQYRSVIFYYNDEQKQKAEEYKRKLNEENAFGAPVVTEIAPASEFYIAEDYHQNYYNDNSTQPYCQFVVAPKLEKFKKVFAGKLKSRTD